MIAGVIMNKLKTTASEHWQLIMAGCQKFESEHPDVAINITGPANETSYDDQQNMIETTLNNGEVDAIIIAPLQSETAATLIAGETRPVFALDTNIDAPEIVSFIGTGNEAAAKLGASEAVKAAKAAGWETIECIEIAGVKGDATNTARMNGSTGACQAILDGLLTMSIAQQPYEMGYLACQTAYEKLQGKEVDAVIDPGIEVISPENAQARIDKVNGYLAGLN